MWQTSVQPSASYGLGHKGISDASGMFASDYSRISVLVWNACSRNGSYTVASPIVEGSGCSCSRAHLSLALRGPQQPLSERSSSSAAPAALRETLLSAAALQEGIRIVVLVWLAMLLLVFAVEDADPAGMAANAL